jgi:hypothetical protein
VKQWFPWDKLFSRRAGVLGRLAAVGVILYAVKKSSRFICAKPAS